MILMKKSGFEYVINSNVTTLCIYSRLLTAFELKLIRIYGTPTLDILLYGDPSLSHEINQTIFHHVHRYILTTQRF